MDFRPVLGYWYGFGIFVSLWALKRANLGCLAYWSDLSSTHQPRQLTYFDKLYWIFFDIGIIGWVGGHCLAMPGGGCGGAEAERRGREEEKPQPPKPPHKILQNSM